jgi:hypothetical protein|tara:strand:- start:812 stop:943 length:132 start_codon:yes stop_codon:yes gene_type:complete
MKFGHTFADLIEATHPSVREKVRPARSSLRRLIYRSSRTLPTD